MLKNIFKKKENLNASATQEPLTSESNENYDYYRIGITGDGRTTFTIRDRNGFSLTLSMDSANVRKLIRLLESTLEKEDVRTNS